MGFSTMENDGKPNWFWAKITSCVLLSVEYLWGTLVKMSS